MNRYIFSLLFLSAVILGLFLTASLVWAGPQVWDPFDTCTIINCNSTTIRGAYLRDQSNKPHPFILQIYSGDITYLRIDVTSQSDDMEIVLISPSGVVWRNDDRDGANDRRPLIKADPTDGQGWYTLQISHYSGGGVAGYGDDFTLHYGWYNSGNPNCSNPTPSY